MCKNCKSSELGKVRQAELDAAKKALDELGVAKYNGFIAKYATEHPYTATIKAALDCYNAAVAAMKKLHEDYVFHGIHKAHVGRRVQVMKERYKGMCGVIVDVGGPGSQNEGCWLVKFDEKPAEWDSEVQWFLFGWICAEIAN